MSQFVATLPPPTSANTPSTLVERDSSGNFAGEVITGTHHESDTTTTPTIAWGPGAYGSPASGPIAGTIAGNDHKMLITLEGANTLSTNATIGTVTFSKEFQNAPNVTLTPANSLTAKLTITQIPFVPASSPPTAAGFSFMSNTSALAAGVTYQWWATATG